MTRRSTLEAFRSRQAQLQLLVSTVSPAVVLLKIDRHQGMVGAFECRPRIIGQGPSRYGVILLERWSSPKQSSPDEYFYGLNRQEGPELLAFHLHPGTSDDPLPHLHLGAGAGALASELGRAHIPTGPVGASQFVRFLIEEIGARTERRDWAEVLASIQG